MELLRRGLRSRTTGATKANAASSRSHCIFSADLQLDVIAGDAPQTLSATLTLVDLAGGHTSTSSGQSSTGDLLACAHPGATSSCRSPPANISRRKRAHQVKAQARTETEPVASHPLRLCL